MVAWAHSLIKVSSVRLDELVSGRVIELPSLVARWIAHKDGLLRVRRQPNSLVLLDVDIGKATKDPQQGDIRLGAKKRLVGSGIG